ncbi:MAG TPA: hypothetical protein VGH28_09705 [Polyangiaceae bacterium]|jgi:hypothetical protein
MRSFLPLVAVAFITACGKLEEPPPPPFMVSVVVEADQDVPIPGAVVQRNNAEIGKTDVKGKAILTFSGEEGDQIDVWVKCPDGFDSPTKPVTVALRRLGDPTKLAEYPVKCPPAEREVVVALLADNGPNLPVKYLGRDVARTDASGAATFMLKGKPGDHLDFLIDTSAKENEKLRPQNPSVSVMVDNKDGFYSLDQPFQVQKARIVMVQRRLPQAIGPTELRY